MPLLVFIGGQSASGKSTIAEEIKKKLGDRAAILSMDHYYKERPEGVDPDVYRQTTNFDTPEMIDFNLFIEHLRQLLQKNTVNSPIFSFISNQRDKNKTETIHPSEIIIIEGIFAQYCFKHLLPDELKRQSLSIYVASDYLNVVKRRIKRDEETRNRTAEKVKEYEQKYVGPGFFKWTASSATPSNLVISNDFVSDVSLLKDNLSQEINEIILEIEKALKNPVLHYKLPDTRDMIANSHLLAGTLINGRFEGYFYGMFGIYPEKGFFKKEFSQNEINCSRLIADLNQYITDIEKTTSKVKISSMNKTNYVFAQNLVTYLQHFLKQEINELPSHLIEQQEQIIEENKLNYSKESEALSLILENVKKYFSIQQHNLMC